MFRRRHPIPLWWRLRGWLWPYIGWRRLGIYLVKRVTRLSGTPHSIAAGGARGPPSGVNPRKGPQQRGGRVGGWVVRGNYIACAVGTLIGNPATFFFIWPASYQLGHWFLGGRAIMPRSGEAWTMAWLLENYERLVWPMTVGGVPLGIVAGLLLYFPLARAVSVFQEARRRRRERRQAERDNRVGMPDPSASPGTGVP